MGFVSGLLGRSIESGTLGVGSGQIDYRVDMARFGLGMSSRLMTIFTLGVYFTVKKCRFNGKHVLKPRPRHLHVNSVIEGHRIVCFN